MVARRIKTIAVEYDVPMVENKIVAEHYMHCVELGEYPFRIVSSYSTNLSRSLSEALILFSSFES